MAEIWRMLELIQLPIAEVAAQRARLARLPEDDSYRALKRKFDEPGLRWQTGR
jgi:hypothetical protein